MRFCVTPRRAILLAASLFILPVHAQDAPTDPARDEVRQQLTALREAVIQQTRQIDQLTAEVARLNRVLSGRRPSAAPAGPALALPTPSSLPTVSTGPGSAPVALPAQPVEAAPTGPEHVVAKGEYLTVIAKKYNTTVDELQKLNRITDPRKIQVGQVLKLPPTATIPPSPTPSPTP